MSAIAIPSPLIWYRPQQWGAVGNELTAGINAHDDTQALQNAINFITTYGGVLNLGDLSYKTTAPLIRGVDGNGSPQGASHVIRGDYPMTTSGQPGARIIYYGASGSADSVIRFAAQPFFQCQYSDFVVACATQGNIGVASGASYGIHFDGTFGTQHEFRRILTQGVDVCFHQNSKNGSANGEFFNFFRCGNVGDNGCKTFFEVSHDQATGQAVGHQFFGSRVYIRSQDGVAVFDIGGSSALSGIGAYETNVSALNVGDKTNPVYFMKGRGNLGPIFCKGGRIEDLSGILNVSGLYGPGDKYAFEDMIFTNCYSSVTGNPLIASSGNSGTAIDAIVRVNRCAIDNELGSGNWTPFVNMANNNKAIFDGTTFNFPSGPPTNIGSVTRTNCYANFGSGWTAY